MTPQQLLDAIPEEIDVIGYKRMEIQVDGCQTLTLIAGDDIRAEQAVCVIGEGTIVPVQPTKAFHYCIGVARKTVKKGEPVEVIANGLFLWSRKDQIEGEKGDAIYAGMDGPEVYNDHNYVSSGKNVEFAGEIDPIPPGDEEQYTIEARITIDDPKGGSNAT